MLRLLMIADDFTGALDTGVQLAAHGIPTQVVVGQADLSACSSTVLVVDTETRHLPAAKAAKAVEELTRSAVENGVGCRLCAGTSVCKWISFVTSAQRTGSKGSMPKGLSFTGTPLM